MIILVGESASGKSSIEKELVNKYGYEKTISYTTRSPRKGEIDGVDYHFICETTFIRMKEEGRFAEIGQYNGWWYGTDKKDCTNNKVVVLTPYGMRQIKRMSNRTLNMDTTCFYINVPRRDRLIKILQRGDNIEEAYRRSLSDVGQFDGIIDEVDFVINNPNYQKSISEMTKELLSLL